KIFNITIFVSVFALIIIFPEFAKKIKEVSGFGHFFKVISSTGKLESTFLQANINLTNKMIIFK
ncbi:hypothetical protein, partial [Mesomycoplasma ovipneumoniae]|uniref:hypothetical protein n=1 Tax=Mesomycoplasma ovipneumoniae TaxID=29562 RepID=UPI002963CAA2